MQFASPAVRTILIALAFVVPALAQSFVQISSIGAYPSRLTCVGPGATTHVRLQIYLAGIPESTRGDVMQVSLSTFAAHPSTSKIDIRDASREVQLLESPTIVDYEVNCSFETLPGVISLGATIASAPRAILIKEPVTQPIVHLKIERP